MYQRGYQMWFDRKSFVSRLNIERPPASPHLGGESTLVQGPGVLDCGVGMSKIDWSAKAGLLPSARTNCIPAVAASRSDLTSRSTRMTCLLAALTSFHHETIAPISIMHESDRSISGTRYRSRRTRSGRKRLWKIR